MEVFAHKVVIVGDSGVGKSSIISAKQNKPCAPAHTVGAGCFEFHIPIDGRDVRLDLWDTAGQEAYHCLIPLYARDAHVGIVVYDQSRVETFDHLEYWIKSLDDMNVPNIIVVGHKTDCEMLVDEVKASEFCREKGLLFLQTTVYNLGSIEKLFQAVAQRATTVIEHIDACAQKLTSESSSSCC